VLRHTASFENPAKHVYYSGPSPRHSG